MKSVLYVGATLMIGASIYGFVDYKQTQHKKEFKEMYVSEKKTEPALIKAPVTPALAEKKQLGEARVKTKKQVTGKISGNSVVDPAREDINIATVETGEIAAVNDKTKDENKIVKKVKKKRKLDSRLFSRAPLRDEEELTEPAKSEEKKIENKEQ